MPDIKEVYEMVTKQKPPQPGALERQFKRQRRAARNRRLGAFAVAAAFVIAVGVVALATRPDRTTPAVTPTVTSTPPLDRAIVYNGLRSIEADGSGLTRLQRGTSPAWSSDGTQLAYVGPGDELSVMDPDGSAASTVGRYDGVSSPAWSPDGNEILFSGSSGGGSQLFIVHPDGSGLRQLTHVRTPIGNGPNFASWSPDGSQIVFSMRRSASNTTMDIFAMNPDGTDIRDLTADTGSGFGQAAPQWSPDGSRIVYTVATTTLSNKDIYTMAPDGSDRRLLRAMVGEEPRPHWSPDGQWIVYTADAGGSDARLVIVDRNGQNERSIDAGANPLEPAW